MLVARGLDAGEDAHLPSISTGFVPKGRNYTTSAMAAVGSPELLIVMGAQASSEQVDEVVARLEEAGASAHVSHGRDAT